jgi:hypothetical protein
MLPARCPNARVAPGTDRNAWTAYGRQVAAAGWAAIPLLPPGAKPAPGMRGASAENFARNAGKAPGYWAGDGWMPLARWAKRGVPTAAELDAWSAAPAGNIGLRLGEQGDGSFVVAVDCDVRDGTLSGVLGAAAAASLGPAPVRTGQAPKWARLFRVSAPMTKAHTAGFKLPDDAPGAKAHRLELLAAGQQLAVYGRHPSGTDYTWAAGRGPHQLRPADLPLVTPDALRAFLADAEAQIAAAGGQRIGGQGVVVPRAAQPQQPRADYLAKDRALCIEAIRALDFSGMSRDEWVRVAHAIKGALGDDDDARGIWVEQTLASAKSSGNPTSAERVWDSIADSAIRSGAGSVFHLAFEQGWKPPPGHDFDTLTDAEVGPCPLPPGTPDLVPLAEVEAQLAAAFDDFFGAGGPAR